MRTTLSLALFTLVGGASVTAAALGLKGEDALRDVTTDLLTLSAADCGGVTQPSGNLVYEGGGSNSGQASLAAGLQQVTPMSRALAAEGSLCTIAGSRLATAEGLVFGLDAVAIVANASLWQTCNGIADPSCSAQSPLGMVHDRVVTPDATRTCAQDSDCNTAGIWGEACSVGVCTYALTSWKEALRILFAGQSAPGHDLAQRNCNSPERRYLASNWNRLFATCSEASCPAGVHHAFRLSDTAGATRVFVDLLDLPAVDPASNQSPFCNVSTKGPTFYVNPSAPATCAVDADCAAPGRTAQPGTCNAGVCKKCQTFGNPATSADLNSGALPTPLSGYAPVPPPNVVYATTPLLSSTLGYYAGPSWPEFQDRDVIRRACPFPSEDVCGARGDLGLVLPIADVSEIGPEAFPTEPCQSGKFACFPGTLINGGTGSGLYAPCPDGAEPNISGNQCPKGQCAYPVRIVTDGTTTTLDPRCIQTSRLNNPSGDINIASGAKVDARVYNLTTWVTDPTTPGLFVKGTVTRPTGVNAICGTRMTTTAKVGMVGAYYRIHSSHSLKSANGAPNLCRQQDGSAQIGCLVQASPCSVGFAGRNAGSVAVNGAQDAIALKVNGVDPAEACVRHLVASGTTYPLAHKLYLNTVLGFGSVTGSERKLSECFAERTLIDPVLASRGLTTLSAVPSDRPAYCEDFDESAVCGMGVNANACKDSPNNGSPVPSCEVGDAPASCSSP